MGVYFSSRRHMRQASTAPAFTWKSWRNNSNFGSFLTIRTSDSRRFAIRSFEGVCLYLFFRPTSPGTWLGGGPSGSPSGQRNRPPCVPAIDKKEFEAAPFLGLDQDLHGEIRSWMTYASSTLSSLLRKSVNSSSTITIAQSIPWNAASMTPSRAPKNMSGFLPADSARCRLRARRPQPCLPIR